MADLNAKNYADMQKIKEKKHYTKPGFFSKSDIADLRGDYEINAMWSKGNKENRDLMKSKALKFVETLPDLKIRQLAGLHSENTVGVKMSDKKIKLLSAEARKHLKRWRLGDPISPDHIEDFKKFLKDRSNSKNKKFRS